MTTLERSIAAYAAFLDEQSLARSPDHNLQSNSHQGELIVVDIQARETETKPSPGKKPPTRSFALMLAAAAVVIVIGAIFVLNDSSGNPPVDVVDSASESDSSAGVQPPPPSPDEVVEAYMGAYNSGDIDAVMALFTEESQVSGHPFGDASGLTTIRTQQERDIALAAEDAYTISNLETSGATVTWDHVWTSNGGLQYCAAGHEAVIENGTILSWDWPSREFCSVLTGVVEAYVEAYNSGDIDAVMALFTEESEVSGHPFGDASGLTTIRSQQGRDIGAAAENAYTISNLEASGATVTWDHVWTSNGGLQYCAAGHEAVIENGTILSWDWPPGELCS